LKTTSLFAFPAQAAARRGEWNDVAAVLDWLGSADLSCHPINPYGPARRAESHKLSLFALLILFDMACHATRRADVFDYIERFYNAIRRHSTIGYVSPVEFERKLGLA
jgi:hypothetical protein